MKNAGWQDHYEDVSIAGAAKNIVDPYDASDAEFTLRQVGISRKLHGITDVILINHLDCGAYGHGTFATLDEERNRHLRDLERARQTIEKRFPGLTAMKILARLDAAGQVEFEKIA